MPRRTDIHTILIIGSGPIVIGQGCEFDYSGVQACRALKEEGYRVVHSLDEGRKVLEDIGLPLIIRPAFTLGGTGGGIAYNVEEFEEIVQRGLDASPVTEVLIEQSVIGWKEYELEVMRDRNDNVVVICSIENFDPMGVHTGDSITVAPIQTLTDKEYQRMRDAAIAIIRAVGVETGGSNMQFAVNPANGEMVVVEMNPRVSRSSALASKATGYPIAKIAAKLAVGYTLDELPNYITSRKSSKGDGKYELYTSACFEPTIDYCVIKIPRWTFEKFPDADETTQGESAINEWTIPELKLRRKLAVPSQGRLYYIRYAMKMGWTIEKIHELTKIDPWFLGQMKELVEFESELVGKKKISDETLRKAKELGYSDVQIANVSGQSLAEVKKSREKLQIDPVYKLVDTCAAEFEA